jgi:hypothetical protein
MSGDISNSHNSVATGISRREANDAARCPTKHKMTRNSLAQMVNIDTIEKPYLRFLETQKKTFH